MDAKALAEGILASADRRIERQLVEQREREQQANRERDFFERRAVVRNAIDSRDVNNAGAAVAALIEIRQWLNPLGGDFWSEHDLTDVLKADTYDSRKYASLILKTALFDGDGQQVRELVATAIKTPREKLGDVGRYIAELLECWWARGKYPTTFANGQPCLEATPYTTEFSNVGEFAAALSDLPGFSRETIDRKRKDGHIVTMPPWEPNASGPRRYKFCDAGVQRKVLDHLRSRRTLGTMLHPNEGTDDSFSIGSDDETCHHP